MNEYELSQTNAYLLEEAGQNNLVQRTGVLGHVFATGNRRQDGADFFAQRQRMELNLQDFMELAQFRADTAEDNFVESLLQ
jgi:hypothetical protein